MATIKDAEIFIGDYENDWPVYGPTTYKFRKNYDAKTFTFIDMESNGIMKYTLDKWREPFVKYYTDKTCLFFDIIISLI